jgi:hypothetical protein
LFLALHLITKRQNMRFPIRHLSDPLSPPSNSLSTVSNWLRYLHAPSLQQHTSLRIFLSKKRGVQLSFRYPAALLRAINAAMQCFKH